MGRGVHEPDRRRRQLPRTTRTGLAPALHVVARRIRDRADDRSWTSRGPVTRCHRARPPTSSCATAPGCSASRTGCSAACGTPRTSCRKRWCGGCGSSPSEIHEPVAFLTTMVTRLALDQLTSGTRDAAELRRSVAPRADADRLVGPRTARHGRAARVGVRCHAARDGGAHPARTRGVRAPRGVRASRSPRSPRSSTSPEAAPASCSIAPGGTSRSTGTASKPTRPSTRLPGRVPPRGRSPESWRISSSCWRTRRSRTATAAARSAPRSARSSGATTSSSSSAVWSAASTVRRRSNGRGERRVPPRCSASVARPSS